MLQLSLEYTDGAIWMAKNIVQFAVCWTLVATGALAASSIEGRFTPTGNKAWLFIGQDSDTISAYQKALPEDILEGVTLYTSLLSGDPANALPAVFKPADWGAGEVDFAKTLSQAPGAHLAIGLAIHDNPACQSQHTHAIASGEYNASLDKLLLYLESLSPRKVFLRIGYEFDGPWNCYHAAPFKQAFITVAKRIRHLNISNIATVWQSAVWPDASIAGERQADFDHAREGLLQEWYPGDEWVDWVGMSVFYRDLSQWHYEPPVTPDAAQQSLLAFARLHQKPVMIAEAAPQGYRTGAGTHAYAMKNEKTFVGAEAIWKAWYQPLFDFIDANRDVIRALAYINAEWETQPMWRCDLGKSVGEPGCSGGNWGDSRVQADPYIKRHWMQEISNPDKWQQIGAKPD